MEDDAIEVDESCSHPSFRGPRTQGMGGFETPGMYCRDCDHKFDFCTHEGRVLQGRTLGGPVGPAQCGWCGEQVEVDGEAA